jgi:peptide chain release factor 2
MITIEQLKATQERLVDLKRYLDIDQKIIQLEEEELRTQVPGFWDDQKAAEAQMRIVKGIRSWIEAYNDAKNNVDELALAFDFYKEELVTEEEVDAQYKKTIDLFENIELKNMLQGEEDHLSCVLKINAGAGGTEAQDWASMLQRMYLRYAEDHGYKATISDLVDGDEAGIKSVTMQIEGEMAYGYLKSENGVHRLVRVSPYNAQGKRMTSFASVFAFPLIDDTINIEIEPARLSWDTFRSGGAGGQNVNKVESGVRLRYMFKDPYTGVEEEILIENTETRDQPKNKEKALLLLKSQLYDRELQHRRQEQAKIEAGKKKIEWGSQIRSYVFDDRRVKDHRTGFQTSDVNGVMDGKIDGFIKAYLMEFGGA